MPYTIFDIANGEVTLSYNGKDLAGLQRVMSKAFPADNATKYLNGKRKKYYFKSTFYPGKWACSDELPNDKPVQSLALFEL